MKTRIREVRKTLNLTQEQFSSKIGVKRSAISQIEQGFNQISEQMIKTICLAYNVNEDWLRTGEGNMFVETKESFLESVSKQFNLEDLDIKILESYVNLSPDKRKVIKDYLKSLND